MQVVEIRNQVDLLSLQTLGFMEGDPAGARVTRGLPIQIGFRPHGLDEFHDHLQRFGLGRVRGQMFRADSQN